MISESKNITIIGAGAIGSFYGAKLARAGHKVTLLLRSDLEPIRKNGITIREKTATWLLRPDEFRAAGSTKETEPADIVLITLKTTGNSILPQILPPTLKEGTCVVTLQNGLGNEAFLATHLPEGTHIMGGTCFIGVTRGKPGELIGFQTPGAITLGEHRGPAGERTIRLAELISKAGIPTRPVNNLLEARWKKLVWNIPFNGLSVVHRTTCDAICADPKLASESRALMDEVAAIAAHFGINISQEFRKKQFTSSMEIGAYKPSSLVDFLAGRELEIESMWGIALQQAQAAGIPVPHLESLYNEIKKATVPPRTHGEVNL